LQRRISGQLQNSSHANGKDGKTSDAKQIAEKAFEALPAAKLIDKEKNQDENASKKADIII
jgi:hypothetical protein